MNINFMLLYLINTILVLFLFTNDIKSLQSNANFRPKVRNVYKKVSGPSNGHHTSYNDEMKASNGFSFNERFVLEKKIKENLLDLLKNYHASSMSLR